MQDTPPCLCPIVSRECRPVLSAFLFCFHLIPQNRPGPTEEILPAPRLVELHLSEVKNGIGDEATLKRVRLFPDRILLLPENNAFAPLIFVGPEMNDLRILGKAVAFTSPVR